MGSSYTLKISNKVISNNYSQKQKKKKISPLLLTNSINLEQNDEYDKEFIRMRDESQKSKQAKMSDDLEKAKHVVEEWKRSLAEKKKQVDFWKNKVDRACIERIRAFQSPPALIGQIMEMLMVLIGKKKFPENMLPVQKAEKEKDKDKEKEKDANKDDKANAESKSAKQNKPSLFSLNF